ncbi:taste receptor type 2 member 3 [Tupaia chinensis]|uniref:Taste receptor type 2 n=1 Tax=Tupaia chinensis TaxID=246437 RepID=L9L1C6_TUPCH|nr:taste receptor type 2 member 3 [Tupaia chinensis]ELW68861.1 Taste receptor type 2 member 3 [Tupaia chinensis]
MLQLTEGIFLVLSAVLFILGTLANGFIGLVNGSSWFKSKRISLSDFIITSLALSRIIQLSIIFSDSALLVSCSDAHDSGTVMQVIDIFWTFTNHMSIWLTTCLSVLYCLKIASFSYASFLWLKWRVFKVIVCMLLGALLSSCGSCISLTNEFKIYSILSRIDGTENTTEYFRKKSEYDLVHVLGTLWNLPPFLVSLASNILLILSLGRHTRQMKQNGLSSKDPSTEAHKKAIKTILSSLFLLLLYFLAYLTASSSHFIPETRTARMTGLIIAMIYPSGHSFILVLGNNRMKQMFVEMLRCKFGHLKPESKRLSPIG